VIESARRVTGQELPFVLGYRRPGAPAILYADSQKIQTELGWKPRYTEIDPIVETAWTWFQNHPDGYGE
jgi:UDP-glucose 4-epimerase